MDNLICSNCKNAKFRLRECDSLATEVNIILYVMMMNTDKINNKQIESRIQEVVCQASGQVGFVSILYHVVGWTLDRVDRIVAWTDILFILLFIFITTFRLTNQQVSNGHWFDPGRTLLEASLAQW